METYPKVGEAAAAAVQQRERARADRGGCCNRRPACRGAASTLARAGRGRAADESAALFVPRPAGEALVDQQVLRDFARIIAAIRCRQRAARADVCIA